MVAPFVAQQIPRKIGSHSAKTPTFISSGLTSPLSSTPSCAFFATCATQNLMLDLVIYKNYVPLHIIYARELAPRPCKYTST